MVKCTRAAGSGVGEAVGVGEIVSEGTLVGVAGGGLVAVLWAGKGGVAPAGSSVGRAVQAAKVRSSTKRTKRNRIIMNSLYK